MTYIQPCLTGTYQDIEHVWLVEHRHGMLPHDVEHELRSPRHEEDGDHCDQHLDYLQTSSKYVCQPRFQHCHTKQIEVRVYHHSSWKKMYTITTGSMSSIPEKQGT